LVRFFDGDRVNFAVVKYSMVEDWEAYTAKAKAKGSADTTKGTKKKQKKQTKNDVRLQSAIAEVRVLLGDHICKPSFPVVYKCMHTQAMHAHAHSIGRG